MIAWLPVAAAAGSAVAGGFYFAFSAVVMPALCRRPPKEAIASMVSINGMAVKAPFMVVFFGTAAACGAVAVTAAAEPGPQAPLRIAGAAAYLAGWASTMAVNVPLNNSLLRGSGTPDRQWDSFHRPWTRANNVRAALSIAGAAALILSMDWRQGTALP